MLLLIAWTAHSSWQRTSKLSDQFTRVQLESFRIADNFQEKILELNNAVLRYGVYHELADWKFFENASTNLDHWIDEHLPVLRTKEEKHILDLINTNYDDYMAAARQ